MSTRRWIRVSVIACGALGVLASSASAQKPATPRAWTDVDQALGRAGAMQPGDVYKFGFPRSDLSVNVAGIRVRPALALGSWVAFKRTSDGKAVAMGDLVLTGEGL